jgi:hypothetical protein
VVALGVHGATDQVSAIARQSDSISLGLAEEDDGVGEARPQWPSASLVDAVLRSDDGGRPSPGEARESRDPVVVGEMTVNDLHSLLTHQSPHRADIRQVSDGGEATAEMQLGNGLDVQAAGVLLERSPTDETQANPMSPRGESGDQIAHGFSGPGPSIRAEEMSDVKAGAHGWSLGLPDVTRCSPLVHPSLDV